MSFLNCDLCFVTRHDNIHVNGHTLCYYLDSLLQQLGERNFVDSLSEMVVVIRQYIPVDIDFGHAMGDQLPCEGFRKFVHAMKDYQSATSSCLFMNPC